MKDSQRKAMFAKTAKWWNSQSKSQREKTAINTGLVNAQMQQRIASGNLPKRSVQGKTIEEHLSKISWNNLSTNDQNLLQKNRNPKGGFVN